MSEVSGFVSENRQGALVLFGPPPSGVTDELRTVRATPNRTGERVLTVEEFDDRASRALARIEDSATGRRLWTAETDNFLTGGSADIVMCAGPQMPQGIAVGELLAPSGEGPDGSKNVLQWLGWLAEKRQLALVIHAPFVGHRENALAFAAKMDEAGGSILLVYLARLFTYPSEAAKWRGRGGRPRAPGNVLDFPSPSGVPS